ncbi:ROK family protein [bacterium]|nr:ROK family protein [bacterium]
MSLIGVFDVGGTHTRAGVVKGKKLLFSFKEITPRERGMEDTVDFLAGMVRQLEEKVKKKIPVLSMGIPGIVSPKKGMVYASPHYPQWQNFKLVQKLKAKTKKKIIIDNDAHMIAYGERIVGAAKNWDTFLLLTLGTGIGGAIMINNKVFQGTQGFAGEFGHLVINPEGPLCGCGGQGCLETYASGSGLIRMVEEAALDYEHPHAHALQALLRDGPSEIVKNLSVLASQGNVLARDLFGQFGYYLGMGLSSIINITGIQNIVLGGGIIKSSALFMPHVMQELKKRLYQKTAEGVVIKQAKLGDKAGLIGAWVAAR